MAGHGPPAKPPGTAARRQKSSTKATLKLATDHDIPAMPPAENWFAALDAEDAAIWPGVDDEGRMTWPRPVVAWWNDIWSSPMSNEFINSDIQGLYLGAYYLAQTVNPAAKLADRLSAGKAHEAAVRNYGLNPMARRSLQWEIERVSEAQDRGEKRRRGRPPKALHDDPAPFDPRAREETDENPFTQTG